MHFVRIYVHFVSLHTAIRQCCLVSHSKVQSPNVFFGYAHYSWIEYSVIHQKKKKKKNTLCLIRDSQHSSQILQSYYSNHLRSQVSHLKNFITHHNLNLCSTRLLSFSNLRSISESLVEFYRRYYYHCYSWIYFRTFTAQIYTRVYWRRTTNKKGFWVLFLIDQWHLICLLGHLDVPAMPIILHHHTHPLIFGLIPIH